MDPRVAEAMAAVPRRNFLPPDQVPHADEDRPLPIGHGQTNSQPTTVLHQLSLLEVRPGHRVLDVGSGSGWTTAILGHLVGPSGSVVGVEILADLVTQGRVNLARCRLPWVSIEAADPDSLGLPDRAPFDRVLCSAEASEVPSALVDQLAVGGLLVVPVRGELLQVRRTEEGTDVVPHGHYLFVPLREPRRD